MKLTTLKFTFIAFIVCLVLSAPTVDAQWAMPAADQQLFSHGTTTQPQLLGFGGAHIELREGEVSPGENGFKFTKQNGVGSVEEAWFYFNTSSNVFHFTDENENTKKFTIDADNGNFESVGNGEIDGNATIGGNAIVEGIINVNNGATNTVLQTDGLELIWHEEVSGRTSWGFDGEYNFFADELRVGGTGGAVPAYQLEVMGSIGVSGEINGISDRRLKRNIAPIDDALSAVSRLNPVHYDFRIDEFPQMDLPQRHKMGFIAQELEEVYPTLVTTGTEVSDVNGNTFDSKSVSYLELIPVLTKAIQEQQAIIESLKLEVAGIDAVKMEMAQLRAELASAKATTKEATHVGEE